MDLEVFARPEVINLVLSGSESSASLRGPYDAVNIGKSLHINDSQVGNVKCDFVVL